ncbi:MAG: hypothetical protein BGO90_08800 [Legionella sp. 40-6]|nr:DUF494 family protein [Legionella sp.]OJY31288.1 MAG: hypothetical protein BGO90_08800 [Legionella sp. 40-6]
MKDNLFEMLLNLFEQSLNQLQKRNETAEQELIIDSSDDEQNAETDFMQFKNQDTKSTRVLIYEEQMKMSKASYQFLMRMKLCNVLTDATLETVLHQLLFSESRIVTLQETKWIIRNALSGNLSEEQLAFLDLVLYQTEDEPTLH